MTDQAFSARCESCGLGYEIDSLPGSRAEFDCPDCGGPLYVVDAEPVDLVDLIESCAHCRAESGGVCVWHDGFGAGWDACLAVFAEVVGLDRAAELAGVDLSGLVDGVAG